MCTHTVTLSHTLLTHIYESRYEGWWAHRERGNLYICAHTHSHSLTLFSHIFMSQGMRDGGRIESAATCVYVHTHTHTLSHTLLTHIAHRERGNLLQPRNPKPETRNPASGGSSRFQGASCAAYAPIGLFWGEHRALSSGTVATVYRRRGH
jgi:hypothetical protein